MNSSASTFADIEERITAIQEQEVSHYRCANYLSPDYQRRLNSKPISYTSCPPEWVDVSSSATSSVGCLDVRAWRVKICEWSYEVVDHFNVNRCIVEISFSYLDRFLATRQKNKYLFQLAAMTTLYLAIKLFETKSLKMSSFIELSRDSFTIDHIAAMELVILRYVLPCIIGLKFHSSCNSQ